MTFFGRYSDTSYIFSGGHASQPQDLRPWCFAQVGKSRCCVVSPGLVAMFVLGRFLGIAAWWDSTLWAAASWCSRWTWPNRPWRHRAMMLRMSTWPELANTSTFVMWSVHDMPNMRRKQSIRQSCKVWLSFFRSVQVSEAYGSTASIQQFYIQSLTVRLRQSPLFRTRYLVCPYWGRGVPWFLVHPASKTHWATRFLQLLLSYAASSTSSQLIPIDSKTQTSRPRWVGVLFQLGVQLQNFSCSLLREPTTGKQ